MVLLDNGGGAVRGTVVLGPPPPDLDGLVEHVVVQTHPRHEPDWRIVPNLSPHLIVSVVDDGEGRRARAFLVGARSRSVAVDVNRRVVTVGVRLRPALSGRSFLRLLPNSPIAPSRLPMPLPAACFANARLVPTPRPHFSPASCSASSGMPPAKARQTPFAAALARACRVKGMAAILGVAERTLRDRVIREIGLSPKRALAIVRLYRALFGLQAGRRSWAAVAQAAGYADQAHLARECRALLGEPPSAWLARGSADLFKTGAMSRR